MKQPRETVGWREWVALPGFEIPWIKAKVDTGARTSSLHAVHIESFTRGGRPMVRFRVHPEQRVAHPEVSCEAPLVAHRGVRPSTGVAELRPVVRTPVTVLGTTYEIELTLTNRALMGFRLLLGRQALRGRHLVDPGSSYLGGRPRRRKKRRKKDPS